MNKRDAVDVVNAFEHFYLCLTRLDFAIAQSTLPFAIQRGQQFVADQGLLRYTIKHLSSEKGLSTVQTYKRPGVIACSPDTLTLVHQVNVAKTAFKDAVKEYCQQHGCYQTADIRHLLAQAGYGLIRLKEVYRQFTVIDQHPSRVTWFQSKDHSSVRLSKKDARTKLLAYGESAAIQLQLKKLTQLERSAHLVIRHHIDPVWYANVSLPPVKGKKVIRTVKTSVPIFYLFDQAQPPPIITLKTQLLHRRKRQDCCVDDNPYLPTLHAYRVMSSQEAL